MLLLRHNKGIYYYTPLGILDYLDVLRFIKNGLSSRMRLQLTILPMAIFIFLTYILPHMYIFYVHTYLYNVMIL